ncbi:MAG: response regulator [Chitinivibrionales bacterium]|nr:response regulator [Chitinivibrionales bacterium]
MATKKNQSILIVEDDESARFGYQHYLKKRGFEAECAASLQEAKASLVDKEHHAVLLDLKLPDGNAIDWLPELKKNFPLMPVIVITGVSDVPTAVKAIKLGAENFLTKPIELDDLVALLEKSLEYQALRRRVELQERLGEKDGACFGKSKAMGEVLDLAGVAAANDSIVLLQGETGTGKGVLAKWIHKKSQRKPEPFVQLNCSALKNEMLRSELFGHTKGAFTSAVKDRQGLMEAADTGTLFLDEIGDLDMDVQAQVLTAIEERTFRRVGENKMRKSNFRLICATNRDLLKASEEGGFRSDLYYRICIFPINLPPIRTRPEDIAILADFFLKQFGYRHFPLSNEVLTVISGYDWPGNVRELRNMLERALLLARNGPLQPEHFPGLSRDKQPDIRNSRVYNLVDVQHQHVLKVVEEFNGDKYKAAEALGISLSSLYRRLDRTK